MLDLQQAVSPVQRSLKRILELRDRRRLYQGPGPRNRSRQGCTLLEVFRGRFAAPWYAFVVVHSLGFVAGVDQVVRFVRQWVKAMRQYGMVLLGVSSVGSLE